MGKLFQVVNYTYVQITISLSKHQLIEMNSRILYEKKMQQTLATSKKELLTSKTAAFKILDYILQNMTKSLHSLNLYLIFSSFEPIPKSGEAQVKFLQIAQYKDRDAISPYLNDDQHYALACYFQDLARLKTYTEKLDSLSSVQICG